MAAHSALTEYAFVALVALLFGVGIARLRQPPVVGYIIAGVVLGPSILGIVKDQASVAELAEMGVLLLLFVIGMELSLRAFRAIWRIALATVALQIAAAVGLMLLIGEVMAWPLASAVLLAFVVAISSTAVAIKMLDDIGELRTHTGRIVVGVLIGQDLAVVPMIVLIDMFAGGEFDARGLLLLAGSLVVLAALILFLSGRRRLNLRIFGIGREGAGGELLPVMGLVICFSAASVAGAIGLTPAYGAFLAGLVIGNSNLRSGMLDSTMPIQTVLIMVFFLSIGLLIDLRFLWLNLGTVLLLLLVVSVIKTVLNIAILGALGLSWPRAFLAGVVLAQVGEFSFLLTGVAARADLIGEPDFRMIVTVTALSLATSPFWLASARRLHTILAYRRASFTRVLSVALGRKGTWYARAGVVVRNAAIGLALRRKPAPDAGDD